MITQTVNPSKTSLAIYIRVSSEEQTESGLGLDGQLTLCRQWCERNGFEFSDDIVFRDESIGGGTPLEKCPGLLAAVDSLDRNGVLLIAKRDRVHRDRLKVMLLEKLLDRSKCRLISATGEGTGLDIDASDPSNMLLRGVMDLFAEYERMVISFRTKCGLHAKMARGERVGSVLYGYTLAAPNWAEPCIPRKDDPCPCGSGSTYALCCRDCSSMIPDPGQQSVISEILEMRNAGTSFRGIAAHLNKENVPTQNGGPWVYSTVRGICQRNESDFTPLAPKPDVT